MQLLDKAARKMRPICESLKIMGSKTWVTQGIKTRCSIIITNLRVLSIIWPLEEKVQELSTAEIYFKLCSQFSNNTVRKVIKNTHLILYHQLVSLQMGQMHKKIIDLQATNLEENK